MSPTSLSPNNISIDAIFAKTPLLKPFFTHLPGALHALLKKDGESLERLQLIEMNITQKARITHPDDRAELGPVTIRRLTDGDLFLKLNFSLFQKETEILSCEITYFIRGQKKFFKPEIPLSDEEKIVTSQSFDLDLIRAFFAYLCQENSMFVNDELVRLARTTLVVPSQIIASYLIGISSQAFQKVTLVFFNEIKPGEPFDVQKLLSGKGTILVSNHLPIACLYGE